MRYRSRIAALCALLALSALLAVAASTRAAVVPSGPDSIAYNALLATLYGSTKAPSANHHYDYLAL